MKLQIENKSRNIKTLKGTRSENLSNSKFVAPKAITYPKINESKLNWN